MDRVRSGSPAAPSQPVSALVAGITDLALLLVVMRLFVRPVGPPSYLALISAVCLMVGMLATEYLAPSTPDWLARAASAVWIVAYCAWGAIPRHPATRTLGSQPDAGGGRPRRSAGFMVLFGLVLATPTISFARVFQVGISTGVVVLIGGTAELAALMFLRTGRVLRTLGQDVERRRHAELAAIENREQLAAG